MNKIFKNKHFKCIYILALIFLYTMSCKNGSTGAVQPSKETRLLKINIVDSVISKANLTAKVGEDIIEMGELTRGVNIPLNSFVDIVLTTTIPDAAVFWSGRRVNEDDRRKKEFSIYLDENIYLTVTLGDNSTKIEAKKLNVSVEDNGKLVVNNEVYTGYNIITFAEGENIQLEAKPDKDFFFAGWRWDDDSTIVYEKTRAVIMASDKYLSVPFASDVSVNFVVSPIINGTVKINGANYDVNKDYQFNIGDSILLEAQPDPGYSFLGWRGDRVTSREIEQFNIQNDTVMTPVFADPNGVVVFSITPLNGPNKVKYTISRSGQPDTEEVELSNPHNVIYYDGKGESLMVGDELKFTAFAGEGYKESVDWAGFGANVSEGQSESYIMTTESKALSANFKLKSANLTVKVVRRYVDANGDTQEETDSMAAPGTWGFKTTISGTTTSHYAMLGAYFPVGAKDKLFAGNKYGDPIRIEAVNGAHYTFEGIRLDTGPIQKPVGQAVDFNIRADTTVYIYLDRKSYDVTLNITGGHTDNFDTVETTDFYTSKVKVNGSLLSDKDYPASTASHTIKTLSGATISFSPVLSDVHNNTVIPATINNISATENVSATFVNKSFPVVATINRRLDTSGNPIEHANLNVNGGFAAMIGDATLDANNLNKASYIKNIPYGDDISIGATGGTHYTVKDINGTATTANGLIATKIKVKKANAFTVDLTHKRVDINLKIVGGNNQIASTMYTSSVKVEKTDDSGTGYATDGTYQATGGNLSTDPTTTVNNLKVLSGKDIKLTTILSSMHILESYDGSIITPSDATTVTFTDISVSGTITANIRGLWQNGTSVTPSGGVYQIYNAGQLAWIAYQSQNGQTFSGSTVRLMNHIDMSNMGFTGIATKSGTSFAGTFDGNKQEVYNLYISNNTMPASFTGRLDVGATVKGLGISGKIIATGSQQATGIASLMYRNTTIQDSYNTADVIAENGGAYGIVGHMLHSLNNGGNNRLERVYNAGKVYSENGQANGIAEGFGGSGGINDPPNNLGAGPSFFQDVYNIGLVDGKGSSGIVGYVDGKAITRVYNGGVTVSRSENSPTAVVAGYNASYLAASSSFFVQEAGGINSTVRVLPNATIVKPLTKSQFGNSGNFSGWDFGSVWEMGSGLPAGSGVTAGNAVTSRPVLRGVGPSRSGLR